MVHVALATATQVHAQERATLPPPNPFLIQGDSVYPSVHFDPAQTDTTSLPVWKGETKIEPSQVQWLPGVTTIGTVHRPYAETTNMRSSFPAETELARFALPESTLN